MKRDEELAYPTWATVFGVASIHVQTNSSSPTIGTANQSSVTIDFKETLAMTLMHMFFTNFSVQCTHFVQNVLGIHILGKHVLETYPWSNGLHGLYHILGTNVPYHITCTCGLSVTVNA